MIKFAYSILYVEDVSRTLQFYEKAFDLKQKFITPDNSYGELITGETTLSFASHAFAGSNFKQGFLESNPGQKPFGMEIGFTTEDVEGLVKKTLDLGAELYSEPQIKPWGQTVAYIRDINGFLVEICSPMS